MEKVKIIDESTPKQVEQAQLSGHYIFSLTKQIIKRHLPLDPMFQFYQKIPKPEPKQNSAKTPSQTDHRQTDSKYRSKNNCRMTNSDPIRPHITTNNQ